MLLVSCLQFFDKSKSLCDLCFVVPFRAMPKRISYKVPFAELKYFNRHNSDGNFKKIVKETSHDEWVLRFNQEIERLNSVSRTATTAVNESYPKTGEVSMSARSCEDNEGDTSLNTSSDRSLSLRESTDLEITHITGEASSSGMKTKILLRTSRRRNPSHFYRNYKVTSLF